MFIDQEMQASPDVFQSSQLITITVTKNIQKHVETQSNNKFTINYFLPFRSNFILFDLLAIKIEIFVIKKNEICE